MSEIINLTWGMVEERAATVCHLIRGCCAHTRIHLYGVPRGGIYAAQAVTGPLNLCGRYVSLVEHPDDAHFIIDDLIDSGATRDRFAKSHPDKPFLTLLDKKTEELEGRWISFPWERMSGESGPQDAVRRLIQYIGDDPGRDGLKDTPDRVVRSYAELFSGYKAVDLVELLKTFDDPCDEMVVCKGVEVYSVCEHHMMPFVGTAHIAYIPDGRIVGLSKLPRLLEVFARRLQVQERLTQLVTQALDHYLHPKGSACVIEAKHFCVCSRGVGKQHSSMITSSLTGAFRRPEVRAEFFNLIGG